MRMDAGRSRNRALAVSLGLLTALGSIAAGPAQAAPPTAELLKDIFPGVGSSDPSFLRNANGILFFAAEDGVSGRELWRSDGTVAGTVLVKDINPGAGSSNPIAITVVGGTLLFVADDGVSGAELWKSDGTAAGTLLVRDINPGGASSSPGGVSR
jgi:ELWxxDGT repeat protein